MPYEVCGCCNRNLPASQVRYTHSFRDKRPDMDYCQGCYDIGCDLEVCDLIHHPSGDRARCEDCDRDVPLSMAGTFVSHDISALLRQVCAGSYNRPEVHPPSDEELAEVYRSIQEASDGP